MDKMVGYCGLVCTDCPAYMATKGDDQAALARVAASWREEYNAPDITAESVVCDGCVSAGTRHCGHWHECDIRICGADHGVANCAHCSDYACDKLERFFGFVPGARVVLDGVRSSL